MTRAQEIVELRAIRIELAAHLEIVRTLAAEALRHAAGLSEHPEVTRLLTVLAHGARVTVSDGPPVLVLGRWSDGARSGPGLALVVDGAAVVRRLRDGALPELEAVLGGGCDAGEAALWLEAMAPGLVEAAEDLGVERSEVVAMVIGVR